jgi:type II secretory pathway component PulJ
MSRSRQGFQLVEIMVALAIVIGPLFITFATMRSNAQATQSNADQQVLDEVTSYLVERLCSAGTTVLDGLENSGGEAQLDKFLEEQAAALPESVRATYTARLEGVIKSKNLSVEKDIGGHENLYQFAVTVTSRTGAIARGIRILQMANN